MKKAAILFSAVLMTAFLAFAQDTSMSGTSSQTSNSTAGSTITGCLSGSNGAYTLTDRQTGTVYSLAGKTDALTQHVGHEVQVTGQKSGSASNGDNKSADSAQTNPNANPGGSSTTATFQVDGVRMISDHCGATGAASQAGTTPGTVAANDTFASSQTSTAAGTTATTATPDYAQPATPSDNPKAASAGTGSDANRQAANRPSDNSTSAPASTASDTDPTSADRHGSLPQTASSLPLLGLLAAGFLGAGLLAMRTA